jgi:CAAX prenyl protease-like protein
MNPLREYIEKGPAWARVLPFAVFLVLTFLQDWSGEAGRYWCYLGKTVVGVWLVWELRRVAPEVRWAFSWEAVAAGVAVMVIWVGLDPFYPQTEITGKPWNPHEFFGEGSALAWFALCLRVFGMTFVVPPLEEAFYRSFLYRYLVKLDFLQMPLSRMHGLSFVVTSVVFGLVHHQWLAGILCGLIYQFLVIRKGRLGDAMTAHAITNFLLGVWVIWKGDWKFF